MTTQGERLSSAVGESSEPGRPVEATTPGGTSEPTDTPDGARRNGHGPLATAPDSAATPEPVGPAKDASPTPGAQPSLARPTPAPLPAPTSSGSWGWLAPMLVLMLGSFMSVLDSSIVNTAIPTMQSQLGASVDDIEWVATAYTMALGVVVPVVTWLGNRVGTTLLHRYAMVGFAVASALCGLAWNLNSMIVFRVLQAIPGGVLPVVTLTILYRIVPREKIGTAMGIYGLGVIVAPAIGPTAGGYFVDDLDWRLIFYINVPVGVIGAILALFVLPRFPRVPTHRFDLFGFLTIAYALFALLLATSKGQKWHWTSYPVLILLTTSALSFALFFVIENEVRHPLIDIRVFRNRTFLNSLAIILILILGLFSVSYYIPQFLQNVQGLTALNAGELLLPQALALAALMPVAGRLYDKFGPRWLALIGLSINAYGTYLLASLNVDTPEGELILDLVVRAVGTGLALMPIMTNGLNALPRTQTGYGSAVNNIVQRVSSSLGVAVLGALVSVQTQQSESDYGALIPSDAPGSLLAQITSSAKSLLGFYQTVELHTTANSYDDVLFVTAILSTVCIPLALFLKKPTTTSSASSPEIH